MRILISGASGFVGKRLRGQLPPEHQIVELSRRPASTNTIHWNIQKKLPKAEELENFDAVIHLAGENIFGLWTRNKKQKIYESRIKGTSLLVESFLQVNNPPKVFLAASATGIYEGLDRPATEESPQGIDFLATVCKDWEATCQPLNNAGVRVVNMRFGIVIDPSGGMLKKMLLPFKLGLGAWLGNGQQKMSWISLTDLVRAVEFCLTNPQLTGPVNFVAPEIVSNQNFCKALAADLKRPCFFGIPKFVIQMLAGREFAKMLLANQEVVPRKLLENGFQFSNPTIKSSLEMTLG